ncbi:MAG TPA: peroxiredoxin [Steroidobacteraceae bacterium]|nr:peroxiredoxin [Steroidobacteraceae bacterium]
MKSLRTFQVFGVLALLQWAIVAGADVPRIGSPAPEFKLQDQNGKWHELKDYRGKWIVLYFYPKDQTPGCTEEACDFTDNIFGFRDAGAVVLGISVDDVASHKRFEQVLKEKHQRTLPFTLLADPSKQTARTYGVLKNYLGAMELARRETFLIDPDGRIVKYYPDVEPKGHSQAVLKDLQELQKQKS